MSSDQRHITPLSSSRRQTQNSIRAGHTPGLIEQRKNRLGESTSVNSFTHHLRNINMSPTAGSSGTPSAQAALRNNNAQSEVAHQLNQGNGRRRMPKPGDKNAPTFDPDKPEELGRFFDRVEDWFMDDDIEEDAEKKRRIVKYLDADSEIQWKALSKFRDGTYQEFKSQVMSSYPAAEEVMKGSVSALKRKIKKIGPVATEERNELLALIRIMTAEVLKLKKISPPIHTNRELVELFLGRLSADFASRVAGKLSMHRLLGQVEGDGNTPRNPEDMYDIEEVMEMAKHTSLEQANPFGKFLAFGTSESGGNAKLEEAVAQLTDSIKLQTRLNQQVNQRLASLQNSYSMYQPKTNSYGTNPGSSGYNRGIIPSTVMNQAQATQKDGCYYCAGPHRIPDCNFVLLHLDMGWLKKVDGLIRLPDGSRLPRDPNKTAKEIVEGMNKARNGSSHQKDHSGAAVLVQCSTGEVSNNADMQNIFEMVQRLGVDNVHKVLSNQIQDQEEDEMWRQNFD